jgi:hypothetical protein
MHGDGVGHDLPAVGGHCVAVGELAGDRRAAHVKSTWGMGLGSPVSWNIAAR